MLRPLPKVRKQLKEFWGEGGEGGEWAIMKKILSPYVKGNFAT